MKAFMEKCQFLLNRKTIEYVYDAFSPSISHTLSGFPCSSLIDGRRKTESDFLPDRLIIRENVRIFTLPNRSRLTNLL